MAWNCGFGRTWRTSVCKLLVFIVLNLSVMVLISIVYSCKTATETSARDVYDEEHDFYDDVMQPADVKIHRKCSYTDGVDYIKLEREKLEEYGLETFFKLPSIHKLDHYTNPCWLEPGSKNKDLLRCLPGIVLAGVAKSATSDLHLSLIAHPDILPAAQESSRILVQNPPRF